MTISSFAETIFYELFPDLRGKTYYSFIDKDKDEAIGIYERRSNSRECYGKSSYNEKNLVILVHWTRSSTSCEEKAQEIAKKLDRYEFDNGWVKVDTLPIDVGRDEREIFERTIDITIINKEE